MGGDPGVFRLYDLDVLVALFVGYFNRNSDPCQLTNFLDVPIEFFIRRFGNDPL